ncbi:MAG: endonuclease/exonuclease/phosphatase family protein [Clostridium butyricum]|nr:endonuclease/exonuclease/phosphatase family protein [Clostridium butyricum]
MRIMTFNLRCDFILDFNNRWKVRKDIAINLINNHECDIIGVQETTKKMHDYLAENLLNYNIVGEPRSKDISDERNDILINKKFRIEKCKTFWLSDTPEKVGSSKWYSLYPRICTTAVINIGNDKIRVCNSHLDCFLPKAREFGLKKLIEIIRIEQQKEELPVIIMGDFNATPNSRLIQNFKNGVYTNKKMIAVQDFDSSIYNERTRGDFRGRKRGFHIDYIFVSEDFEVFDVQIVKYNENGRYPSDHYPVIAEIGLK